MQLRNTIFSQQTITLVQCIQVSSAIFQNNDFKLITKIVHKKQRGFYFCTLENDKISEYVRNCCMSYISSKKQRYLIQDKKTNIV